MSNFIYAQDSVIVIRSISEADITENLLEGLKSDNLGLRISCAYFLGERKSSEAVIPLMSVLRNDKNAEARIMAALSLYKIGSEKGIYAVKGAAEFEEDNTVKKMCETFYKMHVMNRNDSNKPLTEEPEE
jgi:HEAT repeat protein